MKSVVICDTEPVAIEGLRALLPTGELRVVAAETSLAAGRDAVRELKPSLMILDKAFGLGAVLDAIRGLAFQSPGTNAVLWSAVLTESEVLRAMHAGALGAVRKTSPLNIVLDCIRTAAGGATWMEGARIVDPDGVRRVRTPLTSRELQVLELVEHGLTNREIAAELGIRAGTVKIHMKHIFEKTGIHGRYGLAVSGMKEKGILRQLVPVM